MADFQTFVDGLEAVNVSIIGGSSDPLEDAKKAVEDLSITYPVAYGVDAEKMADLLGAYLEVYKEANPITHSEERKTEITEGETGVERKFLQPVGILLRPDKTIDVISYSSGHIGRMRAGDVASLVGFYNSQK